MTLSEDVKYRVALIQLLSEAVGLELQRREATVKNASEEHIQDVNSQLSKKIEVLGAFPETSRASLSQSNFNEDSSAIVEYGRSSREWIEDNRHIFQITEKYLEGQINPGSSKPGSYLSGSLTSLADKRRSKILEILRQVERVTAELDSLAQKVATPVRNEGVTPPADALRESSVASELPRLEECEDKHRPPTNRSTPLEEGEIKEDIPSQSRKDLSSILEYNTKLDLTSLDNEIKEALCSLASESAKIDISLAEIEDAVKKIIERKLKSDSEAFVVEQLFAEMSFKQGLYASVWTKLLPSLQFLSELHDGIPIQLETEGSTKAGPQIQT